MESFVLLLINSRKKENISKHIIVAELGTPRTMERYTKNPKDAVYGYEQSVKQAGGHRMKKETSEYNTTSKKNFHTMCI